MCWKPPTVAKLLCVGPITVLFTCVHVRYPSGYGTGLVGGVADCAAMMVPAVPSRMSVGTWVAFMDGGLREWDRRPAAGLTALAHVRAMLVRRHRGGVNRDPAVRIVLRRARVIPSGAKATARDLGCVPRGQPLVM